MSTREQIFIEAFEARLADLGNTKTASAAVEALEKVANFYDLDVEENTEGAEAAEPAAEPTFEALSEKLAAWKSMRKGMAGAVKSVKKSVSGAAKAISKSGPVRSFKRMSTAGKAGVVAGGAAGLAGGAMLAAKLRKSKDSDD